MIENNTRLISIIIPFFNVKKEYFDFCFDSVRKQSISNFEVIIVDDGSDKIYSKYLDEKVLEDKRFRIIHQENAGVAIARNRGIKETIGDVLCFIDADDYIAPWALEIMWKTYQENDVDAVAAYYKLTLDDSFIFMRKNKGITIHEKEYFKDVTLIGMNCKPEDSGFLSAGPVAVLFNSVIAKKVQFPANIKYMEDVIWNYQFYNKCKKVAVVHECVYAYRQNADSATHAYSVGMIAERLRALQLLESELDMKNEWFALRVLANYAVCCKCCALDFSLNQKVYRKKFIAEMNKNPIWDSFRKKGIANRWNFKQKIKRIVAITGIMPKVYSVKYRRNKK